MNTFSIGVVVGFVLFAVMAVVVIFNKMQLEIARLAKETDNMNKALQMMFLKINKIERVTQETMTAAETFVDGLRESAEHIQQQMMRPPRMGKMNSDTFEDLRQSFEEGIKNMEESMEDSDEDSDEEQEPWK
jgi:hemerythrin-like domain-containing protein